VRRLVIVAASLLLIGLAVAPEASAEGQAKRALVTWDVVGERFRSYLLRPDDIRAVRAAIRLGESAGIPIGRVYRGTQVNAGYRWHVRNVRLVGITIELCDATPSYVERHLTYWIDKVERYCPWGAKPIRLRWVTP
jgi:hypothetical protein